MASNEKQVKVKIATEEELSGVEALELKIQKLNAQKIQLGIDIASQKLEETQSKIENLKQQKANLEVGVDDSKIKEIDSEIAQLEQESVNLQIEVETGKLKQAEAEVENLDGTVVNIDAQLSTQNIMQGIQQAKQGILELKDSFNEVQQAGMQSEQNKAFLEMNLGADKAKQTYQDISDIVASMPGDDNTMRSVLSTAQALGNNLKPEEMKSAAATMADYMSGSATMGKMATESQQDIMKYLLDGNTAELERGSIVSSQVDKLKEATTFQERQAAMQEVLNELGYGGIAQQDTMLNKQAEWEGMIYNSQDALSSMWLGAEKGAMDYILKLNDSTDGLAGMAIVAGQMAVGPLVDVFSGLGQIGTGMKAIKDLNMIQWFKDLEIAESLSAIATWAQNSALWGMIAPILANPITWLVIALIALAAGLIWAYYNVDWFREMVDNAWVSLVQLGQQIYGAVSGAIQWLGSLFNQFTSQLGLNTNDWMQAILGFILFIPQLPLQIGIALVNTLAKVLGFGNNFVQTLINSGLSGVNGFIAKIRYGVSRFTSAIDGIKTALSNCLSWAYNFVMSHPLVQALQWLGSQAANAFSVLGLGQGSPGKIYRAMENELNWTDELVQDSNLEDTAVNLGKSIVSGFGNPRLGVDMSNLEVGMDVTNSRLVDSLDNLSGNEGRNLIINIEIGSVDNEDRVNEIVEAVRKSLAWDNKTAGRSV